MRTWAAKGQVADFVEEERAAVGPLEPAAAALDRPGERPALVAEELRVDQFRRDRAAVDPVERAAAAGRAIMDRPRDQLLAGPGLAEDQDGGVAAGDQFHPLHHRPKPRLDADDRLADLLPSQLSQQRAFVGLGGLAQGGHFPQPQVVLQRRRKRLQQELHQPGVGGLEGAARRRQKNQDAAVPRRIAQRPGQGVAAGLAGNDLGGEKGDSPHLPERPEGCFAQMGTGPFSPPSRCATRPPRHHASNAANSAGVQSVRALESGPLALCPQPCSPAQRPRSPVLSGSCRCGGPTLARWGCAGRASGLYWPSIARSRCAGRPPARRSVVLVGVAP